MKETSDETVAVIMSVYRSDKLDFVVEAINSILLQTYSNIKILIYRDGGISEDVECYFNLLCENNKKVKYFISDTNSGLAFALNFLIDECMGDDDIKYIARMDSDDIAHPERISKQVDFMKKNQVDASGTFCEEFGASFSLKIKKVPISHKDIVEFSITRCPFIHPTMIFRKNVFVNKAIRYPTDTSFTEDMALWFLLIDNGFKLANLNLVLLKYRMNEGTVIRRKGVRKSVSEIKIRFKYMLKLKKTSISNLFFILSRAIFHILPESLLKIAYKKLRG